MKHKDHKQPVLDLTNKEFKIINTSSSPIGVNLAFQSFGSSIRTPTTASQKYMLNSSLVSTPTLVAANSTYTLPLTTANLPGYLYDIIIVPIVDGIYYPQAYTNSPDNYAAATSDDGTIEKNIYWVNTRCFGLGNSAGNNDSANNYMLAGMNNIQPGGSSALTIFFQALTLTSTVFNWSVSFTAYNGAVIAPIAGSATVPANSLQFNLASLIISNHLPFTAAGYATISVTTADSSFKSLLPYYHWGQG